MKLSGISKSAPRQNDSAGSSVPVTRPRGHFRFNTISALALLLFLALSLAVQQAVGPLPGAQDLGYIVGIVVASASFLFVLPYWPLVIAVIAGLWALPLTFLGGQIPGVSAVLTLGFLIAPGIEVVSQWDKIVVLRLGKFQRVRGPGLLFLFPLIDSVAGYVDTRIRVTDFSAEKSLTLDTVPVHVDALAFWMIWDAGKAILEVENFHDAVTLSAQTALRSSIGSNTLTALLSERERLGEEIQQIVDAKTNPWGISIISVEFKEILVPKELEDALSREAQAERERNSRVILGTTEVEIADSFRQAADRYRDDPTAFQLRAMNMIYESMRNKGGLVLAPAAALESMNLGTILGAAAYGKKSGTIPDLPEGIPDPTTPTDDSKPTKIPDEGKGE